MLKLDDRCRRLLAHELDGILIAEPVRAFDGVVHVPAPVILAHVAERRADAALGCDRVAARRKELGDAGGSEARFGKTEGGAQAGAAGADHDHVVAVIDPVAHSRASEGDLQHREYGGRGEQHVNTVAQHQRQGLEAAAVHVVLDDDAHAELRMPRGDEHKEYEPERRAAVAHPGDERRVVKRGQRQQRDDEARRTRARARRNVRRCSHQ